MVASIQRTAALSLFQVRWKICFAGSFFKWSVEKWRGLDGE